MARFAIVRASDLGNRWDAPFHIVREENRERTDALTAKLSHTRALDLANEMLANLPPAHRHILDPLVRTGTGRVRAEDYPRAVAEYPYLALALIEKESPAIIGDLEAEAKQATDRAVAMQTRLADIAGPTQIGATGTRDTSMPTSGTTENAAHTSFQGHTSYALLEPDTYDDEHGTGFGRVETYGEEDGFRIRDCWIVNDRGEIHPGYSESPVPISFDDVDPASAQPGVNGKRVRSNVLWKRD